LLGNYIEKEEGVRACLLNNWPQNPSTPWLEKLKDAGYKEGEPNVVIIDEAQLTYWDGSFWNGGLKTIKPESANRFILFASYGSATARVPVTGTPTRLPEHQQVSLRPVDHNDGIEPIGLLLTKEEFDDMVQRLYPRHSFSRDFLDCIFDLTAGHTGAVEDILRIVQSQSVGLWYQR
jgi:hypothetical protein